MDPTQVYIRLRPSGLTDWLNEAVADPETTPATRTHRHVAAGKGDHVFRDVVDSAAADERRHLDAGTGHRHHWQRGGRRQLEPLFVGTGVVADVVEVAYHEVHRDEPLQHDRDFPTHASNTNNYEQVTKEPALVT